ncbi:MAG: class I SAM-dependent methyltransferase [Chloroflexi bacterium]|nr:class I SAM-dependent methyltransferase [Chloroflexota bacterium]
MTSNNRWLKTRTHSGAEYDASYEARAQAGQDVHGEANLVMWLQPEIPFDALDAGCGTGRVGIELARRGVTVVGVDIDAAMLNRAREKAPGIDWRLNDLATFDAGRQFAIIVMAGNVMIFLEPGTEAAVVRNLARHLKRDGLLIAGFQLTRAEFGIADYDAATTAAGLKLAHRWATWERAAWSPKIDYAVSVHGFAKPVK